jgi:hypothetical protein
MKLRLMLLAALAIGSSLPIAAQEAPRDLQVLVPESSAFSTMSQFNTPEISGNGFDANAVAEQTRSYGNNLGNAGAFRDITLGTDGKYTCKVGYDFVTGVGTPNGLVGK